MNDEVIVGVCFFSDQSCCDSSIHLAFLGGKIWGLSLNKPSVYHMGCLAAFKAELTLFHMDLIPLHYIL